MVDDLFVPLGIDKGAILARLFSDRNHFSCFLLLSDLNNPTVDCGRDVSKYGVLVGIPLGIIAALVAVVIIALLVYKSLKEFQKTKRRNNMDPAEKERLENNIKEYLEALRDPSLDETKKGTYIEELKKTLNMSRGLLVGDGLERDEEGDCQNEHQ